MKELNTVAQGFLEYCKGIKKLKHESLKDIKCTLRKIQRYIDEKNLSLEIWELELEHFVQYISHLRDREERGTGIAKQVSQLRSYIDYCWKLGHAIKNPLYGYEIKDHSPQYVSRFLSKEEVTSLLKATSRKTKSERKERLILLFLYGLGLRTGELCNLKIKDISIENQDVYIKGKFDIERRIPVPDGVWLELLAYLQENQGKRGHLFLTDFKKAKLGIADVGNVLRKYVQVAELQGEITPKVLRHTFATHLIDEGVDIAVISSLMGHKSPAETSTYLHATEKNKVQAIQMASPILPEESKK
jgi:integrase/recombinase XerD